MTLTVLPRSTPAMALEIEVDRPTAEIGCNRPCQCCLSDLPGPEQDDARDVGKTVANELL